MGSILEIINYNAAYPGILVVIFKQYMFLLIFCQFFLFENLFMVLLSIQMWSKENNKCAHVLYGIWQYQETKYTCTIMYNMKTTEKSPCYRIGKF